MARYLTISVPFLLAAALGAAERMEAPTPVMVREVPVEPGGNLTYLDDRLQLHPMAMLATGYNSNPLETKIGDGDAFAAYVAGLEARYWLTRGDFFTGRAILYGRQYQDTPAANLTGGIVDVSWRHRGAQWNTATKAGWTRGDDPQQEDGRTIKRDLTSLRSVSEYLGPRWSPRAVLLLENVNYREAGGQYTADQRDRYRGQLSLGARVDSGSELALGALARGSTVNYKISDTPFQDGYGLAALAEARYTASRVLAWATAGYEFWRFRNDFSNDPSYDDHQVGSPIGNLGAGWKYRDNSHITANVRYLISESTSSNAANYLLFHADLDHRLDEAWRLVADAEWSWRQDMSAAANTDPVQGQGAVIGGGARWRWRDGVVVDGHVDARRELQDPGDDFNQVIVRLGIAGAF